MTLPHYVESISFLSKLHNKMLENVLKAPMSFFDTNPKGRVVNRFAKDVDFVDRAIPMTLEALLRLLFQVFKLLLKDLCNSRKTFEMEMNLCRYPKFVSTMIL